MIIWFQIFVAGTTLAQISQKSKIKDIIDSVNTYNSNRAVERLYLHTDKASYAAGDTIWFKGYLFNASYLNPSSKSGLLYTEIANDSNRIINRIMMPVVAGQIFGFMALEKEIEAGSYVLRGYTSWMRNFGEDYMFKKQFYVGNAIEEDWLVNYNAHLLKVEGKDKMELGLKLTQLDQSAVGLRELRISLNDGKKNLFNSKAETSLEGLLNVNFDIPDRANSGNMSLNIEDLRKSGDKRKLFVPILLNRPANIDLQFMPEGGNLIAGLSAYVAFKAINEDGTGADISGKIYDSKSNEVTDFKSLHRGIGTFYFLPRFGEVYFAKVKLPDGSYKTYPLPSVSNSGLTLKVNNSFKMDSCEILISATPDIIAMRRNYYVVGQTREIVCFGASVNFNNGPVKLKISKDIFPTGIAHISLLASDKNALNERIIYIDHEDNLNIQVATDRKKYQQRDSVDLNIRVTDKNGEPVQGSFSIAVTDNTQVKTDSITNGSIVSYVLLSADLKGYIEDPGYYYNSLSDAEKWQHLDNLLLAQGWIGYDLSEAFIPSKSFIYPAEQEFLVKGKITNAFNKPVASSGVALMSRKPLIIADTISNEQGDFTFKGIFPVDTAVFFIQARNKKGKSFNVGIEMEEFKPPVFLSGKMERITPWYVNIDTDRYVSVNNQVQLKKEQEKVKGLNMLEEVKIKAKKVISGSKNLNGPGEADIIIDEAELEKAGRTTLGDLMEKRVDGFSSRTSKTGRRYYVIKGLLAHLIIDGIDIDFSLPGGVSQYEHFKYFLDYYDAEEIKGIEVMYSGKYQLKYTSGFLNPMATFYEHAFIEVTTRSGSGPFLKKSVGTYVYRPMPFTLPKQFYSPKYTPVSIVDKTDIRSTIYWEPNIITGKDGKANLKFYTADNPGSYTLLIEGTDMQGYVGTKRAEIVIENKEIYDK